MLVCWVKLLAILVAIASAVPRTHGLPEFRVARESGTRPGTFFFHIEDGFQYHLNTVAEGTTYYKCVRYERGCRGRAMFDRVEGFVHTPGSHNHDPDIHYPDEMALRRRILMRCEALEYVSYQQIMDEESAWFRNNPEVISRVTYARMRTPMRNARLRNYPRPQPASLLDLTQILLDPQYRVLTMTSDGNDNIYGGSVTDPDGIHHVLFISDRMLDQMRSFTVLHADGTFRAVPINPAFADQVYCIIGVWNNQVVPLAWVLMGSRTQAAYTAVLQLLQNRLGPHIELRRIITDFETAQQNAWQNVFRIAVQGCLWHLARAFMQQVADYNLICQMRRIQEVREIIRLTLALPLLPENMIVDGFQVIMHHARDEGAFIFRLVRPFLLFIWRYWVSRPWRRARMCVHGSSQRTNNVCECHNRMLRETVGTHPSLYAFIEGLVRLEQRAYNATLALEAARRVTRGRRRTSVMNDNRIVEATRELFNPPGPIARSIFRFLRNASHTMDGLVDEVLRARRRQV